MMDRIISIQREGSVSKEIAPVTHKDERNAGVVVSTVQCFIASRVTQERKITIKNRDERLTTG